MIDALYLSEVASLATLGVGFGSLVAVLAWVRRSARRGVPVSAWVLPLCLAALVVSLLAAARNLDILDPVSIAWRADPGAWPRLVSRDLAGIHATLALGHGTSATVLALATVGMLLAGMRATGSARQAALLLAASSAALALVSGVAAHAAHVRAEAHYRFAVLDPSSQADRLLAAAAALEPVWVARAVATLLALPHLLALLRSARASWRSLAGVALAIACSLGFQLGDMGVTHSASERALVVLRMPWSDGQPLELVAWPDLSNESPRYAHGRPHVVLDTERLVDLGTGRELGPAGAALVRDLRELRLRLAAEDAREQEAIAEAFGEQEAAAPHEVEEREHRSGMYQPRPRWEGCDAPLEGGGLSVVVDRRVSAGALRQLVVAASEAGFGRLTLIGPVAPSEDWTALGQRDPVAGALLAHRTYGLSFDLPVSCVAGVGTFLRGTVESEVPSALEHSSGARFPLRNGGLLSHYRELTDFGAEVVLALGPRATPGALAATHARISAVIDDSVTFRLMPSPEGLPHAEPLTPLAPLPLSSGVDAGQVLVQQPRVLGSLDGARLRTWLRQDLLAPLEGCARAARADEPEFDGVVVARMALTPESAVSTVSTSTPQSIQSPLTACVAQVFSSSRYPGVVTGDFAVVTVDVALRPREPQPAAR